jgi:hypothetical protein
MVAFSLKLITCGFRKKHVAESLLHVVLRRIMVAESGLLHVVLGRSMFQKAYYMWF